MKTGTKIRELRKRKGLTVLQLATAIDSYVSNISHLERNIQGHSESTLTKIAASLGVAVADLFSDTDP